MRLLNLIDTIEAVCRHLEVQGFTIEQRGEGTPNIEAVRDGRRILIKVTGQTNPDGERFTDSQVKAHVARLVLDALRLTESRASAEEIWLAMPADSQHQRRIFEITTSLRKLEIGVIWVGDEGLISPFA